MRITSFIVVLAGMLAGMCGCEYHVMPCHGVWVTASHQWNQERDLVSNEEVVAMVETDSLAPDQWNVWVNGRGYGTFATESAAKKHAESISGCKP